MWSDAMGQGEKAYPFVCPECGEEVRGNERHFSIQPLLNRIMLTIEGNRTSIGEELERFITVYASFGAEFLSSPLQTVQCETAKPENSQAEKRAFSGFTFAPVIAKNNNEWN